MAVVLVIVLIPTGIPASRLGGNQPTGHIRIFNTSRTTFRSCLSMYDTQTMRLPSQIIVI